MRSLFAFVLLTLLTGCASSFHPVQRATLGVSRSSADLEAIIDEPGPVSLESIVSSDWEAGLKWMLNLDHPRAREAGLTDRQDPVQIYFHVLRHPTRGTFIVETGVEKAMRDAPDKSTFRGMDTSIVDISKMKIRMPLGEWLAKQSEPLRGVFLTHLHFDHIAGMADVPAGTAVYTGPGEVSPHLLNDEFKRESTKRALAGKAALSEWDYKADPAGRFEGVIDIFGDGSVWALWVPGHTAGSTAYLVRTPQGPVLLTGDASHTRWGWENGVEPGLFSEDRPKSAESLARLRKLAAEHPAMQVLVSHQP